MAIAEDERGPVTRGEFEQGLQSLRTDMENYAKFTSVELSASVRNEIHGDFARLRTELRQEIHDLRTEMHLEIHLLRDDLHQVRAELRDDLHQVRAELRDEIHQVRDELRAEIHQVRDELRDEMQELRAELRNEISRLDAGIDANTAALADLKTYVGEKLHDQTRSMHVAILGYNTFLAGLLVTAMKFL